jgi:hypothetical protein
MNSEDLLFKNNFVNVIDPRLSKKNNSKNSNFIREYTSRYKKSEGLSVKEPELLQEHEIEDLSRITVKIEKKTIVTIDSKDRDINKYPFQNNFTSFLGRAFNNVKSIALISTEIPNTDTVIKELPIQLKNNVVSWINEEDYDLGIFIGNVINTSTLDYIDIVMIGHPFEIGSSNIATLFNSKPDISPVVTGYIDGRRVIEAIDSDTVRIRYTGGTTLQGTVDIDIGHPTYSISIKPGNYTASTLSEQIANTLNNVKRRNGTGQYHYFEVSVNLDTDVMLFDSVFTIQLSNNPISTSSGSSIITVNAPSHSLKTGDRVKMLGVKNTAGISGNILKGDFIVTVLDFNTFTYEINERAVDTVDGGGNVVKIGKDAPFRLLFNTGDTKIQFNTGYPDEDSSLSISKDDPITTKALNITSITSVLGGEFLRITTDTIHDLIPATKGSITSILQVGDEIIITTNVPHLLDIPQTIFIRDSNCFPSIDGYSLGYPIGDYTIAIDSREISVNGNSGEFIYDGDVIKINNIRTAPPIDESHFFYIEDAPTANDLIIKFKAYQIDFGSRTTIGTEQIVVNHPNHSFNKLSTIENYTSILTDCKTLLDHSFIGSITNGNTAVSGPIETGTVDITIINHSLATSDTIKIENSTTSPDINGVYIIQVVDINTVRINFIFATFVPGTCTIISGDTITISETNSIPKLNGTFNLANKLVANSISTGTILSTIVTDESLGWKIGDRLVISGSDCSPVIDGIHYIQSIISPTSFTIDLAEDVDTPGTIAIIINTTRMIIKTGLSIISPGTNGIIGKYQSISMYRIVPKEKVQDNIGGILINALNKKTRNILKIIDKDNYSIRVRGSYSTKTVSGGGESVSVSSLSHGYRSIQANTEDGNTTGTLFRSINLAGENFLFLKCQGLETVVNSSGVPNVFAKILLSDAGGNMVYNSYISAPKIFNPPEPRMDILNFEMVTPRGYPFNFNDIDWSFSLEVIEMIDTISINHETSNSIFLNNDSNSKNKNKISEIKKSFNKSSKLDTALGSSGGVIRVAGGRG